MDGKSNLNPCLCGCKDIVVEHDVSCGIHMCSIGCTNVNCDMIVTKIGLSKSRVTEKAFKAWNEITEKGEHNYEN